MWKFKLKRAAWICFNAPRIATALMRATFPHAQGLKPMEIKVYNRRSIANYTEALSHIIISIGDPYDREPAPIAENKSCLGILRLTFHDWDDKQKHVIENSDSSEAERMVFFSEKDAKDIFNFVQSHIASIELIICQCDAGISRSAGLAAALSRILNGTDEYFFKRYIPNSRVYRIMLNKWSEELSKI